MSNRLIKTLQSLLRESLNTPSDREWGTDSLVRIYKQSTPGQEDELDLPTTDEAWEKISTCQQCHAKLSSKDQSQGFRVCAVCAKRNHTTLWDNSADTDAVDEARTSLTECVGVTMKLDGKIIVAKNRDRAYHPDLEVVHEVVNDTEIAYLHDMTTDWSEGMNEHGIGIVNTALFVGYDEDEKKIIKDKGKKSKDGARIRAALAKKTVEDVVKAVSSANGGVKGHTLVVSPDAVYTIELTSQHKAHIIKRKPGMLIVRTNHGDEYPDAGYTQADDPDDFKSSTTRYEDAVVLLKNAKRVEDVLPALRTQKHGATSNLNVFRDTNKMKTSSQLLMNLTDCALHLHYVEDKVATMHGVNNRLPKGYTPKIHIKIQTHDEENISENVQEAAEYQGRKVTLNDPFRTPDGPKKFAVYVKNEKGNVIKLGFGDPNMEIKRDDPDNRKNFRARHNCDDPGPKWKARYWSCQWGWNTKKLDEAPLEGDIRMTSSTAKKLTEATFKTQIEFSGKDKHGQWQSKKTPYTVQALSRQHAMNKALEYAKRLHDWDALDQSDAPSLEVRIVEQRDALSERVLSILAGESLQEANKFVSPHPVHTIIPIHNPRWGKVAQAELMYKHPNGDDWRAQTARGTEVFTITWPDVQQYSIKKESVDLTEKFFDGYDGHGYMGYTEVWIDPSGQEIVEAAHKRQTKVNANFKHAPAATSYYCRGWLTDKHLFVWSADSDDHMDVEKAVKESAKEKNLSVNFSNALAIELDYFATTRTIGIHMASWSNPRNLTDTQAVKIAQNHPALRGYTLIPVNK